MEVEPLVSPEPGLNLGVLVRRVIVDCVSAWKIDPHLEEIGVE